VRHTTLGWIPLDEWSTGRRDRCIHQHATFTNDKNPCRRLD